MTTIVSRLYESADIANRVAETLRSEGFPEATLSVIAEADMKAMAAARVDPADAERYAKAMKDGGALFVCRAPFTPFGAARRAKEAADSEPWIDAGVSNQNRYVEEVADLDMHTPSILQYHPLMMTRDDYVGSGWANWTLSGVFDWPTVSRRREAPKNLTKGYMSQRFWPQKLLSAKPRRSSVMHGGRHMSRGWWPMPLVRTGTKSSIMKGHPLISERFGWATLKEHR
ncbi:hypothetical protein N8I71_03900 [Roseibacterium sp. SDUM158016]|uniref:hypothetical protein n=1 Tax=Roseicyclus sediminis TaxID=2980997 RepID=UPI0021D0DF1A|nr:hypothetical protein [Roseibacterium sp. SDUM158016]MCU4651958.1 hypothetical protein [Roseibacterium sp. SDUM158016]